MPSAAPISALVRMSQYAGMRPDLVQAGGGNSSVKLPDGDMLIKASGFWLSEVRADAGWSRLPHLPLAALLDDPALSEQTDKAARERWAATQVQARVQEGPRSSIETLLHAAIPQTYVLHTHPLLVNMLACRTDWDARLHNLFPHSVCVPYHTPGLELTLALRRARAQQAGDAAPQLYFLQNHGLIVAADTEEQVYALHDRVLDTLEQALQVDTAPYRRSNAIAAACNAVTGGQDIALLHPDTQVHGWVKARPELFATLPFAPDTYVFCGKTPLLLADVADHKAVADFLAQNQHPPKVVLHKGHCYCLGAHLRKCYEVADVLRFHLSVLAQMDNLAAVQVLDQAELDYLGNWDAEKYRQKR